MKKDNLKKYKKPVLKVHGDLKNITLAGQDFSGDYAGKYGESF
jgi:hypothetical protein